MPGQGQTQGQGEKLNRLIHHEVMPEIGKDFPDLDTLPMSRPNYDFFGRGASLLQSMSRWRSGELDHNTGIVIGKLIHRMPRLPKGQERYTEEQRDLAKADPTMFRGRIYGYKSYLDKIGSTPEEFTFDRYFTMIFKQVARSQIDSVFRTLRGRTPHIPTSGSGQYEESGSGSGILEGTLPDPTALEPSAVAERKESQQILDKVMPDLLIKERNGPVLLLLYQMYFKDEAELWEVGQVLDRLDEDDDDYKPEGGDRDTEGRKIKWSTSTLSRYKDRIINIGERYHRQKELERKRVLTKGEQRAIFQSRRA